MKKGTYDFCGWATRNDLKCSDGRTIRKDAFKHNDGQTVPLVWNHDHNDPMNVLGHALLENREEGVYAYCSFNNTAQGNTARNLVQHGDVTALSIYANQLKQYGQDVVHGAIREVSLVLAGANPGAVITAVLEHGEINDEAAIIFNDMEGLTIEHTATNATEPVEEEPAAKKVEEKPEEKPEPAPKAKKQPKAKEEVIEHADKEEEAEEDDGNDGETVADVFNSMSEKQKTVVYALIGQAINDAKGGKDVEHSDLSHADSDEEDDDEDEEESEGGETVADVFNTLTEKQKKVAYALIGQAIEDAKKGETKSNEKEDEKSEGEEMKHNVFETEEKNDVTVLTHSEMAEIFADAKRGGSLKDAVLSHGIENIEYLFPDAKNVTTTPEFIKNPDDWVKKVMNGVHHTPFSRIKSMFADITEADARAKGYIKGHRKVEEVFGLLKRVTTPTTVYKKQKIDRDDAIDITDFDIVAWLKAEMRTMLDEEIARAILVGDGRNGASEDKINEQCIRPIWTDDELFTVKKAISVASNADDDTKAKAFIRAAVKARKNYRGSGNPTLFTTEDVLTDCLLMEDQTGRIIYDTMDKLATTLRVKEIVTVAPMEDLYREADGKTYSLLGLIVNLNDYNVGADKGGAVNMFDDFDIDYNAQKYLIETRCSGALIRPYSAIALELTYSAILSVEAEEPATVIKGKAVSTLQDDVIVNDKFIKGTLKYVTGYTAFSNVEAEQSGNFLALKFEASTGATTKVQLSGQSEVTLDSDMNCVLRVTSRDQKLKVTTTLGNDTVVKTFSLAGLVLETA